LGVLALTACSASAHTGTRPATTSARTAVPSSTTASDRYISLYTNAVAPADVAITTFNAQAKALTNSANVADLAKIATPLADTLERVDRTLLQIAWPAKLTNDIRAVVAADSAIIADLRNVSKQTARSISTLKKQFSGDLSKLALKVSIVVPELARPQ
jgi:parvulin-like peptidyl-prolyl isomerase